MNQLMLYDVNYNNDSCDVVFVDKCVDYYYVVFEDIKVFKNSNLVFCFLIEGCVVLDQKVYNIILVVLEGIGIIVV